MIERNKLVDSYTTDIFCENLAFIDDLGVNRRLVFVNRDFTYPDSHIVVAKLIIPADVMVTLAYMAAGVQRNVSTQLLALDTRIAN